MKLQSISQYFKHKNVLLTGATGFIGQFVVFKLIKLSLVANIFVVLRPKKDETTLQRFHKFLGNEIFSTIDSNILREKVIPIEGDILKPSFGFTEDALNKIKDTQLFIHSAADLNLNAPFSKTVLNNTYSTRNAIELCGQLPKLEKYVHVSTTYVYGDPILEEKVHDFNVSAEDVNEIIHCSLSNSEISDKIKNKIEPKLYMNNYCISKSLSEIIVAENSKTVDTLIFRPSSVLPALKEPYKGWFIGEQVINNFATYVSTGLMRVSSLDPDFMLPTIPVDICITALLKAITLKQKSENDGTSLSVLNAVTQSISVQYMLHTFIRHSQSYPSPIVIRPVVRQYSPIRNQIQIKLNRLLFETFHAKFVDSVNFGFGISGQSKLLSRRILKMHRFLDSLKKYRLRYEIRNSNMKYLCEKLEPDERESFNCNPFNIDMDDLLLSAYLEVRKRMSDVNS